MSILRVGLLSGFVAQTDDLMDKYKQHGLQRVETGPREIVMYFNEVNIIV